jgi:hypothetical protein
MLCDACRKHFDFSGLDYEYSAVKERTIRILKEQGTKPSLLIDLEDDLEEYRKAVELSKTHKRVDICPWFDGDVSALNISDRLLEELGYKTDIQVWDANYGSDRPTADVYASAAAGCEICSRLCSIIAEIPDFETEGLESWLELEVVSLMPKALRFLFQRTSEDQFHTFEILPCHGGTGRIGHYMYIGGNPLFD